MNLKKKINNYKFTALFLLTIFGISALIIPFSGNNAIFGLTMDNTDQPTSADTHLEVPPLSIDNWVSLSEDVANWLESEADKTSGYSWNSSGDLFYPTKERGAAGIGQLYIELYQETKNEDYLDAASSIGDWLYSLKSALLKPGKWPEYVDSTAENYTGLDKGAAGVGEFLFNLYEVTSNSTILEMAEDVQNYLNSIKVPVGDGAKYPKKESLNIDDQEDTLEPIETIYGSTTGVQSDLEDQDGNYFAVNTESTALSERNLYDSDNSDSFSISSLNTYNFDSINISQQIEFESYPVKLDSGVDVMAYSNGEIDGAGGLRLGLFEAKSTGLPDTDKQIGSWSETISYSSMTTTLGNNISFSWGGTAPTLNGSAPYGYCMIIDEDSPTGLESDECFFVGLSTDNAYSKGKFSYYKYGWRSDLAGTSLVFNITDSPRNYAVQDFGLNLTDYGMRPGFEIDYVENMTLKCRALTAAPIDYAKVYVYNRELARYESFGNITDVEQDFELLIENDISSYLSAITRRIIVRLRLGDAASSATVNVNVLNITLNYNDEYYGFDVESGAAGIGKFYLSAYESTKNETYLEYACDVGNFLIASATEHKVNGIRVATWEAEDGKYYTTREDGVAGIGSFLLQLSKYNATNGNYRKYAQRAANWLLKNKEQRGVFDHLNRYIGTGYYWSNNNQSSTVYTGYDSGIAGIADFVLDLGLSLQKEDNSTSYINLAVGVANFLISSYDAVETPTCAKEKTRMYSWSKISYPYGIVDLSFADGTAGVIKYLNRIYKATHNVNYSTYSAGGYEYLRMNANQVPGVGRFWNMSATSNRTYGLDQGVAGVALALLDMEFSSFSSFTSAKSGLEWLYDQRDIISADEHRYSVVPSGSIYYSGLAYGTAGVGLSFLNMFKNTGNNTWFSRASYCARAIDEQTEWDIHSGDSGTISTGLKHGVAGIGLFMLEMAKSSNDAWYSTATKNIADYLINQAISDGSRFYWQNSTSDATIYYGWDNGIAGIIYFLTEAYEFYNNATYLEYAEGGARYLDLKDNTGAWFEETGDTGPLLYGFSDGAAGIGYSITNLYTATRNDTYGTLANTVYEQLETQLTDAIPLDSTTPNGKYNGIEEGQAGMLNFISAYYNLNKSAQVNASLNTLITWTINKQLQDGSYNVSVLSSAVYNSYIEGTAGVVNGLLNAYSSSGDTNLLNLINNAKDYLIGEQSSSGYWDDHDVPSIENGYYSGVAGIADVMRQIPDLSGPSLSMVTNISLDTEIVQYYNSLEINVSSIDIGSGLESVLLAYTINDGSLIESDFSEVESGKYRTVIPNAEYNTNVSFYIVAIDQTGLLNVDDNGTKRYKFTFLDEVDPGLDTPVTYDSDLNIALLQYETGGRIVIDIDEPTGSSGVDSVSITYNNLNDLESETTDSMSKIAGSAKSYYIDISGDDYDYGDNFVYSITATDLAGNTAQTGDISTTIGDNTLPSLDTSDIQVHSASKIPAYTKVSFSLGAYDGTDKLNPSGSLINEVFLNYTLNGGTTWQKLVLVYNTATGNYEAVMEGKGLGTQVGYMICVEDNAGNVAYYDSTYFRYSSANIPWSVLFKYEYTINWLITILIIVGVAAISIVGYYLYARKTDYWDKMRHQAGATARMISVQERLANVYYAILGALTQLGDWLVDKFTRPPGSPNPIKSWYEDNVSDGMKRFLEGIKDGFIAIFKFLGYAIISPALLIWALVKNTGAKRALVWALTSLCLIIFSVIKYVDTGDYPLRALFFINFGFILFISSFVLLIFHIVYRISTK